MNLGVVVRPELEPETLVEQARAAEAAGFDELWVWEDCFLAGGIAAAATALAATDRITVGLGIMPAPVRNAAFAAMEIATLARLHPGRLNAGLGHGVGAWMHQVGAKPASQLQLLEEVVSAVRALLAGERVSTEGRYVRLRDVALDHPPAVAPPVSVGVRGPKSLELAGRVADGTVLDWLSSPDYVRWARERIGTRGHRVTVYASFCAEAADEAEMERARRQRKAEGGGQAGFLDAALGDLALVRDDGARSRLLAGLEAAGADSVVLVSPRPRVPLDARAAARALGR